MINFSKPFKVITSEFQVLYPDKKIINHIELTPGTIIEMDGYTQPNGLNHKGESVDYPQDTTVTSRLISFGDVRPPLRCKVVRIRVVVSDTGPYMLVDTDLEYSEKEQEILKTKYHSFGLGHINRIVQKENVPVVYRYALFPFEDLTGVLYNRLQMLDNHHCFDLRAIVEKGVKDGVFHKTKTSCWPFVQAKYSKKRMIAWLKQNINRFKQKGYLMKF